MRRAANKTISKPNSASSGRTSAHVSRWAIALLVFAAATAYLNSLPAPFVFDDLPAIVENPSIRTLRAWPDVLIAPREAGSATGRPLVNLSFALNYAMGGLDVRGYHAVNLLLHILVAVTLFSILRRTFQRVASTTQPTVDPTLFALTATLLWAVHPLLTESVTCVVHRAELLGALFYLLTLSAAIRSMETPPPASVRWPVAAFLACLAGVASKEFVVSAPLTVLLYDRTFVAGAFREAWRRRGRLYAALFATWILLGVLIWQGGYRNGTAGFAAGVSAWDYFLTQCRAIVLYLRLAVWPQPLVLDYGAPLARNFFAVLLQALFLAGLAVATVIGLSRRTALGFAGFCFFALLAPSSSFVPLVSQTIAEHRMYLPLAIVVTCVVAGIHHSIGRNGFILGILAAVALLAGTIRRNAVYGSALTLWADTVAQRPENPRAHTHYAQALEEAGRIDEAIAQYRLAAELQPEFALTHYNLGAALLKNARWPEAEDALRSALQRRSDYPEAHANLSTALLKRGQVTAALEHLEAALRLKPDYAAAHYNLANVLAQNGRAPEALPHYEAAARLLPEHAEIHFNFANALCDTGHFAAAIPHYEKALQLNPADADAARYLAAARAAAISR